MIFCLFLLLVIGSKECSGGGLAHCTAPQCVTYDTQTQATCTEVTRPATNDCRWKAGLGFNVDELILHGRIIAYTLCYAPTANGGCSNTSPWFVPGINDLDNEVNSIPYWPFPCNISAPQNEMRRAWAYFYDHQHTYIICS